METLNFLMQGFDVATRPTNLLMALFGAFVGTVVGMLPGLGPINGVALLLPLAACTTAPAPSAAPSASVATPVAAAAPPKLLLISIDGLRADALDRGLTPNLQRLIDGGVRARWMTPSYPSLTFPNHYTIVTGLRPDHHGIVNNSMDDEALGRFEPVSYTHL